MQKLDFPALEIISSYTPRLSGVSVVAMYHFTSKTPTEVCAELNNPASITFNPHNTLLSSGKNNNEYYKNAILNHPLPIFSRNWAFVSTANRFYQTNAFVHCEPLWGNIIKSNHSFNKLYEAQHILHNLSALPFVKQIYIWGSVALEQSSQYSDLDLILVSKSIFGLSTVFISRFWVKLYFKFINRDVHPFLTHYLWIFTLKLGLKNWSQNLQQSFHKYKQSSRLRFDVGLIVDESIDLDTYTEKDVDRLWFLARKKVVLESDAPLLKGQNNLFLNSYKYKLSWVLKFIGFLLEILSLIIYPVFFIQSLWFSLFNSNDLNQYVSYKIWHSFTKVGFRKDRIVRTGNVVYKAHNKISRLL